MSIQACLRRFCGPKEGLIFPKVQKLIDIVMDALQSDHHPLVSSLMIGQAQDEVYTFLKINVSHRAPKYFHALVRRIWNLVQHPRGKRGWILTWEVIVHRKRQKDCA